jgi:hypothetical protein
LTAIFIAIFPALTELDLSLSSYLKRLVERNREYLLNLKDISICLGEKAR